MGFKKLDPVDWDNYVTRITMECTSCNEKTIVAELRFQYGHIIITCAKCGEAYNHEDM